MRNLWLQRTVTLLAVGALGSAVRVHAQAKPKPGFVAEAVPEMPNPPGPAPKHDFNGAWVGPQKTELGPFPAMTPAAEKLFKAAQPIPPVGRAAADGQYRLGASNDPYMLCDPLGFPRDLRNHSVQSRGGIWFAAEPNRMFMLFEQQRIFRDIWMDGRELPKKVDAKDAPDSRYYGYSVGHWDGDTTLVIDTTGLDPRTWLDEIGHPHTNAARLQERWTRLDQYNIQVTVTVDDPAYYTQPFQLLKANYYWMKNQDFEETLCLPSDAVEYREKLAAPSGWGETAPKP
jgi:hypothetical protein